MRVQALLIFAIVGLVAAADIKDVLFTKIGQYTGKDANGFTYTKSYYGIKFGISKWFMSKLVCQQYGMELVVFESPAESTAVGNLAAKFPNLKLFQDWTNVDGIANTLKSKTDWYFSNGEQIPYALNWHPSQPDGAGNSEGCLEAIWINNAMEFNDNNCIHGHDRKFVCQIEESRTKL